MQIKGNFKALRHWPLCREFTGTGELSAQRPVTRQMFPFDDVIMQWNKWSSWHVTQKNNKYGVLVHSIQIDPRSTDIKGLCTSTRSWLYTEPNQFPIAHMTLMATGCGCRFYSSRSLVRLVFDYLNGTHKTRERRTECSGGRNWNLRKLYNIYIWNVAIFLWPFWHAMILFLSRHLQNVLWVIENNFIIVSCVSCVFGGDRLVLIVTRGLG